MGNPATNWLKQLLIPKAATGAVSALGNKAEALLRDLGKTYVVPFTPTVGFYAADQAADHLMNDGRAKDAVRSTLQLGEVVTGLRGLGSVARNVNIKAINKKRNALIDSKGGPLTQAEEQVFTDKIAAKNAAFKDAAKYLYGGSGVLAAATGFFDGVPSYLSSDIKQTDYRPKNSLYTNSLVRAKTLNNQGLTLYNEGIPPTDDNLAIQDWENFIKQGNKYNETKSLRSQAHRQNNIFRLGGLLPDGAFPWLGTKTAGKYDTEDTPFMKASQAFANIENSKGKSIVIDDDSKFNYNDLKNEDKKRFSSYIKALSHQNNIKKIKQIFKSLKDSGIEGIDYDSIAKEFNISWDKE